MRRPAVYPKPELRRGVMTPDELREIMLFLRGEGVKNFKHLSQRIGGFGFKTLAKFAQGKGSIPVEVMDMIRELIHPRGRPPSNDNEEGSNRNKQTPLRRSDRPSSQEGKKVLKWVLEIYEIK